VSRIVLDKDGNPVRLQVVRPDTTKATPAPPRPEVGPLPSVPRSPRGRTLRIETPHGTFHGPADDLITRQLVEFGGHTRNELAMVLSFVAPGDVVLDVGAHIGTFAVPLARKVGKEGRVFAFEPTSANHEFLVRNLRENEVDGTVHVERLGAGDRRETLRSCRPEGNSGAAFLCEHEDGEAVETVALDQWWEERSRGAAHRVAMIKIDTEGMDCRVLQGARRILERDHPVLYFEFNPRTLARAGSSVRELEDLLAELRYHCFVNLGPRNSARDDFRLGRIRRPRELGDFGDVLAFHRASLRYPGYFAGPLFSRWALRVRAVVDLPARALRRINRR
jgi:FkbM family methyltransferase